MKIGIYHHSYIYGSGIDGVLREVAERLAKNNEVDINTFYSEINSSKVKINVLSKAKTKSVFNAYNPLTAIKVIKSVKNYDVVFTSIYPMNFLVSLGNIIYRKRHVAYFWGAPPQSIIKGFFEKLYHMFLHVTEVMMPHFGVNESVVPNEFIKTWNKIKNCKILAIHGVDLQRFDEKKVKEKDVADLKKKHNLPEDSYVIFTLGRVVPYKGIDLLVKMLEKVRERHPNTYLIVGGSLWNKEYIKYLDSIKEEHTILAGLVEDKDMPTYYKLCDVYVSASKWEGQLNSEACAMKKPYVAFDTTSHRYTITEGENGFLVKPYDFEEFAEKVIKLIEDKKLREKMGEKGRKYAEENCDYDKIANKLGELLKGN